MRTHREFIDGEVARDEAFGDALRDADAELDLALQLAEARESQGMTQQELAARLRISQPAVSRYERSGRTPSIVTALRFAEALGVTIILNPDGTVQVVPHDDSRGKTEMQTGEQSSQQSSERSRIAALSGAAGKLPRPLSWREIKEIIREDRIK